MKLPENPFKQSSAATSQAVYTPGTLVPSGPIPPTGAGLPENPMGGEAAAAQAEELQGQLQQATQSSEEAAGQAQQLQQELQKKELETQGLKQQLQAAKSQPNKEQPSLWDQRLKRVQAITKKVAAIRTAPANDIPDPDVGTPLPSVGTPAPVHKGLKDFGQRALLANEPLNNAIKYRDPRAHTGAHETRIREREAAREKAQRDFDATPRAQLPSSPVSVDSPYYHTHTGGPDVGPREGSVADYAESFSDRVSRLWAGAKDIGANAGAGIVENVAKVPLGLSSILGVAADEIGQQGFAEADYGRIAQQAMDGGGQALSGAANTVGTVLAPFSFPMISGAAQFFDGNNAPGRGAIGTMGPDGTMTFSDELPERNPNDASSGAFFDPQLSGRFAANSLNTAGVFHPEIMPERSQTRQILEGAMPKSEGEFENPHLQSFTRDWLPFIDQLVTGGRIYAPYRGNSYASAPGYQYSGGISANEPIPLNLLDFNQSQGSGLLGGGLDPRILQLAQTATTQFQS